MFVGINVHAGSIIAEKVWNNPPAKPTDFDVRLLVSRKGYFLWNNRAANPLGN